MKIGAVIEEVQFQSRSQAGQDEWVYEVLVRPEQLFNGTFLDIGCLCEGRDDLVTFSNTVALEELGWRGLLVDIEPAASSPLTRKSQFIHANAATLDWTRLLRKYRPSFRSFDYLSLDVDEATLAALLNLLKHGVRFRCATIEHDAYVRGPVMRKATRELMVEHGYTLACGDMTVLCRDGVERPFEDWWVDLSAISWLNCI